MQLINMLKKNSNNGVYKVIIHTSCLNNIYAFGLNTFHENLHGLNGNTDRLLFTGENASQMAPERGLRL